MREYFIIWLSLKKKMFYWIWENVLQLIWIRHWKRHHKPFRMIIWNFTPFIWMKDLINNFYSLFRCSKLHSNFSRANIEELIDHSSLLTFVSLNGKMFHLSVEISCTGETPFISEAIFLLRADESIRLVSFICIFGY